MIDFESNLRAALAEQPEQHKRAERILSVLDTARPKRKARILSRMQSAALAGIADDDQHAAAAAGDWSAAAIDWPTVLKTIIDILIKILPLILAIL